MNPAAGYFAHYRQTMLLKHNFSGLPRSANISFWFLFAIYYTLDCMRWSQSSPSLAIYQPIGDYCVMWLFFPAKVRFLWMFVSCTVDLMSLFAIFTGLFDPNVGYARALLFAFEGLYCVYYTSKFLKFSH